MPNYLDDSTPEWLPVYQLELEDDVIGGEDGIDNRPHIELAKRTAYLKNLFDTGLCFPLVAGTAEGGPTAAAAEADRYRTVLVAGDSDSPDTLWIALKRASGTFDWVQIA